MPADTIAAQLERDRLEHRLRRIEIVVSALRERAVYRHSAIGTPPLPLLHAIDDFEGEMTNLRLRLRQLARAVG